MCWIAGCSFWGMIASPVVWNLLWRPRKINCIFSKKFEYIYNCKFFEFLVFESLYFDLVSPKKPGSVYRFRIRIQNIVFKVYSAPAGTLEEEHARRSCPTQARPVTSPDQIDTSFYEHALQIKKKGQISSELRQREIDSISYENKNERSSPSSTRAPEDKYVLASACSRYKCINNRSASLNRM